MKERRRALVAERPAATRLEAALRRGRVAMAVLDADGRVLEATPAFADLAGADPGAVVGEPLCDLVHPRDRAAVAAALAGQTRRGAFRLGRREPYAPVEGTLDDLRDDPDVGGLVLLVRPTDALEAATAAAVAPDHRLPWELIVGGFPAYAYRLERNGSGWRYADPGRLPELTGFGKDELGGVGGRALIAHPDDRARVLAETEQARCDAPLVLEYRIVRRDGEARRVRDEAVAECGPDGRPAVWTGLLVDVSDEPRRAGGDHTEGRARFLLDRLPAAVYEQDIAPDGTEYGSFINRRMEQLLGYGGAEWEPTWAMWEDLIHPDHREAVLAEERRCDASGDPFRMEYRMRARDGRDVWIRDEAVRTALFPDGRQIWHGVMTDITDEVRAREALAASEARFGALVRQSHDLIAVLDAEGVVRYVSPSADRLLGRDPAALVGSHAGALVHPDDQATVRSAIAASPGHGAGIADVQVRLLHADGGWRAFEVTGTNLLADPAVGGIVLNARDVTERVAAERSLRESEARFQGFLDRIPVLALLADAQGRYVWVNEQLRRWFGIDPATLVGKTAADWMPPEAAAEVPGRYAHIAATGEPLESETRLASADGSVLELLSIAFPVSGPGGERLVGVVAVDVAGQRRAAAAERLLAAVVESADEAIVSRALDGTILTWNPGAERLYGYSAEEAVGSSLDMLTPPEFADELRDLTARVERGERVGPIETRRRHKDGHLIDISFTLAPIRDDAGRTVAIAAVARDFSEPIRTREALRQAKQDLEARVAERTAQLSVVNARLTHNLTELERTEEALRLRVAAFRQQAQLLDLANDAIVVADPAGAIRFWNSAAERLYGWSEGEAYAAPAAALLTPVYPEPYPAILAALERDGWWEGQVEHGRKDGSRIVVESRWAVQRDDRGNPVSILTINRDVTERARIERERAELARAARTHARRVEELAQLKDDFTAIVAHELVSPVAAIRWFAEVLAMEGLTAEERDHALDTIRAETDLLHVLVDDVRAIAKVDRDDFSVSPRPVELAEIVGAAAAFARALPGNHPFAVEGRTDGRVVADPARLGQVLRNLLGNAAKYTPPGTPIAVRLRRRGGVVRIEVADEGPGIHPDDAEAIFEKYRRGRQSGNRNVAGAGIGLYVSRRIVQAHGSDLTLSSRPGAGAVFGFELPLDG